MPFRKIPLPELIEQGKADQNGLGWDDFVRIAEKPKSKRPSYRSAGIFFNRDERTIKDWLRRWDSGERE